MIPSEASPSPAPPMRRATGANASLKRARPPAQIATPRQGPAEGLPAKPEAPRRRRPMDSVATTPDRVSAIAPPVARVEGPRGAPRRGAGGKAIGLVSSGWAATAGALLLIAV